MKRQTPNDQARTILTDATTLATLIDPATRNLEQSIAGWPEQTPGAAPTEPAPLQECNTDDCTQTRPCPIHETDPDAQTFGPIETEWGHQPTTRLTDTERLATTHDKADTDLHELLTAINHAHRSLTRATKIAIRYGLAGLTDTEIKESLATVRRDIWCENCSKHGHKNPRLTDRLECEYCADFRRTYKRPAPKEILAIRAFRNIYPQDEQRVLNQIDPNWRKKLKGKAA